MTTNRVFDSMELNLTGSTKELFHNSLQQAVCRTNVYAAKHYNLVIVRR